jgi:hypothetical protein
VPSPIRPPTSTKNWKTWARKKLNVHIALVSGGAKPNRTTFGHADFTQILINFAPRAKQRSQDEVHAAGWRDRHPHRHRLHLRRPEPAGLRPAGELRHSLEPGAHHPALRPDRPHRQPEQAIQLVNFWPTPDLNKYINLKNRVEARMALVDIAATAEDNILQAEDLRELIQEDLRYRDKQLLGSRTRCSISKISTNPLPSTNSRWTISACVAAPYTALCDAFDAATQDGQAMQPYARLLQRAVDAIVAGYRRRLGAALQSSRSAVLPVLEEQVHNLEDFELVTWLVIE